MVLAEPIPVLAYTCLLGEGPVWDARDQRLFWLDITRGDVHQYHPETGRHSIFHTGAMVGAVALRESGGLVAAMQSGFAFVDPEGQTVESIADPEAHVPGNRFNDGKCDPQGRFWAGTMSMHDEQGAGGLYTLLPGGDVEKKMSGVSISNGLAWSLDGGTFYFIDTPTMEVAAYNFDAATGAISHRRTVVTIPPGCGEPDGMSIDSEGMLWIAHWDGWQLTRWDPASGNLLLTITLPVARVTSCTFGGAKLNDIYITSARIGLSAEQLCEQPLAGSLFVLKDTAYYGIAAVAFSG